MITCIVIGSAGRMGGHIIRAIHHTEGIQLVGAVERKGHSLVGADAGESSGIGKIDIPVVDSIDGVSSDFDVLIDFTTPESSMSNLERAAKKKKAAVNQGARKKLTPSALIAIVLGLGTMGLGLFGAFGMGDYKALYVSGLGACFIAAVLWSYR